MIRVIRLALAFLFATLVLAVGQAHAADYCLQTQENPCLTTTTTSESPPTTITSTIGTRVDRTTTTISTYVSPPAQVFPPSSSPTTIPTVTAPTFARTGLSDLVRVVAVVGFFLLLVGIAFLFGRPDRWA